MDYKYHLLGLFVSPFAWEMLPFYQIMESRISQNDNVSDNDDPQRATPKSNSYLQIKILLWILKLFKFRYDNYYYVYNNNLYILMYVILLMNFFLYFNCTTKIKYIVK